jgi:hypothetical protein
MQTKHHLALTVMLAMPWAACSGGGEATEEGDDTEAQSTDETGQRDGGMTDLDLVVDCTLGSECVLVHATCCGYACSDSPLSEFVAVRHDSVASLREVLCQGQDPESCPNCPGYEQENYVAVCRGGQCLAVDVREDVLSRCESADDCRLRWYSDCCEMCDAEEAPWGEYLIAVSILESWTEHLCEDVPGCPACVPVYPDDASVDCRNGHCVVTRE